jgi:hypothetical protein
MLFISQNTLKYFLVPVLILGLFSCNEQAENEKDSTTIVVEEPDYLIEGRAIAMNTFNILSTTLSEKIAEGGIPNAIDYCNLAALPLTDSIAKANDVMVRRVSSKARNSANLPTAFEEGVLANYQSLMDKGMKASASVEEVDGEVYFVAPIIVQPLCLNCHGTPGEELALSNYELINAKYPEDQAINYKEGDLRGIWSIRFNAK